MSYPILYSADETNFDHNGYGILSDCVSCQVSETLNGEYELTLEYPVNGIHFSHIASRAIIKAKPNQVSDYQLFRIYSQTKNMRKNVVVKAEHISYDLIGIPVSPFTASNIAEAILAIKQASAVENSFEFWTDRGDSGDFIVKEPMSARKVLGEIISAYGGELEYDNHNVKLYSYRGKNRGVSIRYGKNLTNLKQEENCSAVYTGVYPYWMSQDGANLVELDEKIINAPGTYTFARIKTVDFSANFQNQPTKEQLKESTEKYIESNHVGVPSVSMDVSFAALEQSSEYKNIAILERVALGDTVTVEFADMVVYATAKAVKIIYNVLLDRVESVSLGDVRTNIADTIAEQKKQLQSKPDKSQLQIAVDVLTKSLLGANGGAVRLLDVNGDTMPDTLYIADSDDPSSAKKVWRFNKNGLGGSVNGFVGPFVTGLSFDSGVVGQTGTFGKLDAAIINVVNLTAESILSKTLEGILLKAGRIESSNGKITIDLSDTEEQPIFNTGIKTNGLTVRNENNPNLDLFHVEASENYGHETFTMEGRTSSGNLLLRISELFSDYGPDGLEFTLQDQKNSCGLNFSVYSGTPQINFLVNGSVIGTISASENDIRLSLPGIIGAQRLFFQPNGDGTYTLMGGDLG